MYNWKKYNSKKLSLAKYFITHNKKSIFNYSEKSYYNHTRDIFCLGLLSLKNQKSKYIVLDYGSNIATLSNINNKIKTSKYKFYIFDPFSSKENSKFKLNKINYKIINNLSNLTKKVNILNFGSSIQYLSDYKKIFKNINFEKKAKIIITASPFTLKKTYFTSQSNQKKLDQKINNFFELVKFFKLFKFNLIFKSSINPNLAAIKRIKKDTFFLNLIFEKN